MENPLSNIHDFGSNIKSPSIPWTMGPGASILAQPRRATVAAQASHGDMEISAGGTATTGKIWRFPEMGIHPFVDGLFHGQFPI